MTVRRLVPAPPVEESRAPSRQGCACDRGPDARTRWPALSERTVPEEGPAIVSEGVYSECGEEGGGRPDAAPFTFRTSNHLWTMPGPADLTDLLLYKFREYLDDKKHLITRPQQRERVRQAFDTWLAHIPLEWERSPDGTTTDCDAHFYLRAASSFDFLGQSHYPKGPLCLNDLIENNQGVQVYATPDHKKRIRFNLDKRWIDLETWADAVAALLGLGELNPALLILLAGTVFQTYEDYRHIATHELGHMLGLGHTGNDNTMMWHRQRKGHYDLHEHDKRAIISLYPNPVRLAAVTPPWAPQAWTWAQYTGSSGTTSHVLEMGTPRRFLAWTSIGWQESLASFDRDNGVFADVFAIGGQPLLPDEAGSLFPKIQTEQSRQLTHQYTTTSCTNPTTIIRPPFRLGIQLSHLGGAEGRTGACAIYRGAATSLDPFFPLPQADRVQFRASAFHPGDHRMFATACVLLLPSDPGVPDTPDTFPGPWGGTPPPDEPGFGQPLPPGDPGEPGFAQPSHGPAPGDSGSLPEPDPCPPPGGRAPPPTPATPSRPHEIVAHIGVVRGVFRPPPRRARLDPNPSNSAGTGTGVRVSSVRRPRASFDTRAPHDESQSGGTSRS